MLEMLQIEFREIEPQDPARAVSFAWTRDQVSSLLRSGVLA
jgi:hypothetical protein